MILGGFVIGGFGNWWILIRTRIWWSKDRKDGV